VSCWGWNSSNQLGIWNESNSTVPVGVSGLVSGVTRIALGIHHSCALTSSGGVLCWGGNSVGQFGNGGINDYGNPIPGAVSGLSSGVAAMSAGGDHTCGLTVSGAVMCWGSSYYGERGDGSSEENLLPLPVVGFEGGATELVPSLGAAGILVLATAMLALGVGATRRLECARS
jgi:alpha-tubulin suppressor-like RCC1 family protein